MVRVRIDKNRLGEPVFKLGVEENMLKNNKLLYMASLYGNKISGLYNYKVPMKYFIPIFNNMSKDEVVLDTRSNLTFLEFSDEFEEEFFYSLEATPKYMRKWREKSCPNIYKITINRDTKEIEKRIAFKKIELAI